LKLPAHVLFRKELSLMVWKPHGILDQALVNEIVAFVKMQDAIQIDATVTQSLAHDLHATRVPRQLWRQLCRLEAENRVSS
jgi:hypothetical protein